MTYAIFSEWTDDEDIRQYLFIPSTNIGVRTLPPTLWTREIPASGVRRKWNAIPNPNYSPKNEQASSLTNLVEHEVLQFEGISTWMTSVIADPAYELRAAFPVLVSTSDLIAISEKASQMPADLAERVRALRALNGLSEIGGVR